MPIALPPNFNWLAPWPSKDWQPCEKHVLVLTPEQALNSNAPAIITTLTRFGIIFQFPVGSTRGHTNVRPSS
ncbi:hypothetical protein EMIT0P294_30487 [Pseudomonas sp. IT-P294]